MAFDAVIPFIFGHIEIVIHLQPQPKMCRSPEVPGETQRDIGSHDTFSQNDVLDAPYRHVNIERQLIRCQVQWRQELFSENLTGMHRSQF